VTDTLYKDGKPAPREVEPGDTIQYGIVVKGNAKFRATDVSVDDVLPAGVKYAGTYEASQGDYDGKVWTIGTLEADQVVTLVIDVTVQPVDDGKIITNTAQLRANGKKIADDGERDGRNTKPTDGWDAVDIVVDNPGATSPDDDGTDDGDNDGDNGGLPDTGSSAGMLAALGAGVLLLLGGGLALAARRRSLGGHER
jgi:uncharacterized repeat protein (TIGR01451 family)/LPXTG-motif cell wall-anchored protein